MLLPATVVRVPLPPRSLDPVASRVLVLVTPHAFPIYRRYARSHVLFRYTRFHTGCAARMDAVHGCLRLPLPAPRYVYGLRLRSLIPTVLIVTLLLLIWFWISFFAPRLPRSEFYVLISPITFHTRLRLHARARVCCVAVYVLRCTPLHTAFDFA